MSRASAELRLDLGKLLEVLADVVMPGELCILAEWDSTGNRRVGRLTGAGGEDVAVLLEDEGLAAWGGGTDWCTALPE